MAHDNTRSDGSLSEEASAFAQRVKGAVTDGAGAVTGNEALEREGERENAEGLDRQRRNDVFDEPKPGSAKTSIREETGAFGERMKGAAKDATGAVLGDERLERDGERENAEGRTRQTQNEALGGSRPRPSDSTWSNKNLVTGLYDTPDAAGKAYQALTSRHDTRPTISVS